ncbi:hypothetical protein RGUI_2180 [Rhodovulum sp. P5]|uniref:esterase-like activity of phytase family protein n=1 Tax=Rhodovulum sp. P5 TaxID=1564506 RepID=UPI0009C30A2C|nr:esterase-like activity of phytase family protein [Rhodovulum sp. P5]ARE40321.1 hypothetical protein RGUI_2180 [Rhodovulum sp. P5]
MPHRTFFGLTASLLLLLSLATSDRQGSVAFVGSLTLPEGRDFKGWSGVEIAPDGTTLFALSDRTRLITATLQRNDGKPAGLTDVTSVHLRDDTGKPIRAGFDSEGLALGPDGALYVSFEGWERVWRWEKPGDAATWKPDFPHPDIAPKNKGLEALAVDDRGDAYTIFEHTGGQTMLQVYRLSGREWSAPFTLPRRGAFKPVGADFGPDGRFYLLERAFYPPIGFASRIRRFDFSPEGLSNETVLLKTRVGRHANLEGLSVWRDDTDAIRLTMVSDNNGLKLLRNQIVEYRVAKNAAGR